MSKNAFLLILSIGRWTGLYNVRLGTVSPWSFEGTIVSYFYHYRGVVHIRFLTPW